MNLSDLLKFSEEMQDEANDLLRRKNSDYSKEDNVYFNFSMVAMLCRLFEVDCCTVIGEIEYEMIKKICRLIKNVNSSVPPKTDSLRNDGVDLMNYTALLLARLEESDCQKED